LIDNCIACVSCSAESSCEVQQLFESWGLSNRKAFKPLLQAVRELAVRDKQDGERRLVEALATQLRMNRKPSFVETK